MVSPNPLACNSLNNKYQTGKASRTNSGDENAQAVVPAVAVLAMRRVTHSLTHNRQGFSTNFTQILRFYVP